jgi:thioredoxin reductase (NADPH)
MLVRREAFRASKIMEDRVKNTPNIEILYNSETVEVLGDDLVTGVQAKNNQTGEEFVIPATGFFVAIGHQPNTEIFKEFLNLDETGYIKYEKPGTTYTNVPGVFVAGDAADKNYRQAITAAGTGCMAALDAERFLAANGH